jgi:Fur family transcriptional regulator, peroxide stress response regulator
MIIDNGSKEKLLTEVLSEKGIRPSFHRLKVLEYLHKNLIHPTADQIYVALQHEIPSLSKMTIYNIVKVLEEAGLINSLLIDNETRFDAHLQDHGHFHCTICGEIINFEINTCDVPIRGLHDYAITTRDVIFKGMCPTCLKNIKKEN